MHLADHSTTTEDDDDDDEWLEEESIPGGTNTNEELELQGMNDVSSANQVLQQHPSKLLLYCTTYPLSTIVQSTPASGATQARMLLPSFNNNHRVCKFHRKNGCKEY